MRISISFSPAEYDATARLINSLTLLFPGSRSRVFRKPGTDGRLHAHFSTCGEEPVAKPGPPKEPPKSKKAPGKTAPGKREQARQKPQHPPSKGERNAHSKGKPKDHCTITAQKTPVYRGEEHKKHTKKGRSYG